MTLRYLLLCFWATAALTFAAASSHHSSSSTTHVKAYSKKDGKTVAAHDRTSPDHTKRNNWSTKGNTNPETGKKGTKNPEK